MQTRIRSRFFFMLLGAIAASMLGPSVASATFPGENGKIVFRYVSPPGAYDAYDLYTVNPDGTGLANISRNGLEVAPAWSPDGTKIAFGTNPEIWVMNADGSGQTNLTNGRAFEYDPDWSPDGKKIVFQGWIFTAPQQAHADIFVMDADGTDPVNLTNTPQGAAEVTPVWSPDGSKIAFTAYVLDPLSGWNSEVFTMNPDGSEITNVTNSGNSEISPDWSPDGTRLVFERESELFTMKADGSDQINLTNGMGHDGYPAWSPDGSKIAFFTDRDDYSHTIFIMNADGSGATPLARSDGGASPDWQAIPNDPSRFRNASGFCKAQRDAMGQATFNARYGGGANAFGRCVSAVP